MTREEAFQQINALQDEYIDKLVKVLNSKDYEMMKAINFTSATGTGKTNMMAKLMNRFPECYFIVTTLSKGQLHHQIRDNLHKLTNQNNFYVYGSADYKINSKLDAEDIIGKIPPNTKCIWLRDEGHIRTNRFDELLLDVCYKVVNFSATNMHTDIQCNFTQTMMLRTVQQQTGTPEDAVNKLIEVKMVHKNIPNYNPCAIFRCVSGNNELYDRIVRLCFEHNLKYIDITENTFNMKELCEDDNEYDVIINKFKIVEGIDIRRAHVLYMDNQPANNATTIQVIGRCRRNALLYRKDIDILSPLNINLLKSTRVCYVYYNVEQMKIDEDINGELCYAFCDKVSCQALKPHTIITVEKGQLPNGLYVLELEKQSGDFTIEIDEKTGFNIVSPLTDFYSESVSKSENYLYVKVGNDVKKIHVNHVTQYPLRQTRSFYDWSIGETRNTPCEPYYDLSAKPVCDIEIKSSADTLLRFNQLRNQYDNKNMHQRLTGRFIDVDILPQEIPFDTIIETGAYMADCIEDYFQNASDLSNFDLMIQNIGEYVGCSAVDYQLSDFLTYDDLLVLQYCCVKSLSNQLSYRQINDRIDLLCELLYEGYKYHYDLDVFDIKSFIAYLFNETVMRTKTICSVQSVLDMLQFNQHYSYFGEISVTVNDVSELFAKLDKVLSDKTLLFFSEDMLILQVQEHLSSLGYELLNKSTQVLIETYLEELTETEDYLVRNHYLKPIKILTKHLFDSYPFYNDYTKINNDMESAVVGVDLMTQIRLTDNNVGWFESKAISNKVQSYNKLNSFISQKYQIELLQARSQCFNGKNSFTLNNKCNSVIGYCVEYYSKYLLYGEAYLGEFILQAQEESQTDIINDCIIIRACMLKYKQMMVNSYSYCIAKVIKGIPIEQLIQEDYRYFVHLVVELGTKTANFVKTQLYSNGNISNKVDPNLSIQHISGLADYITEDTILDVKVQNHIDEAMIRQVLGYHYLSTKRSDLHIKRVIVFDAVSGKSVIVPISENNQVRHGGIKQSNEVEYIKEAETKDIPEVNSDLWYLSELPGDISEDPAQYLL